MDFLHNASDDDLAHAVEDNLHALFRAMATTLPGGELVESEKLCHHLTFPDNPMFKGVWRTKLAPDEVDDAIEHTLAWYRARRSSLAYWWTGTFTQPANLAERLIAHGLDMRLESSPCMALDMHTLDEIRVPPGFSIAQATTTQTLDEWQSLFQRIYDMPSSAGQAWVDATLSIGAEHAPWQLYTGYLHGQPVATNLVFRGAGVAGLLCIGTVPEARGMGIGTAMTLLPLHASRAQGYQYAVLFASDMGYPVYLKMGFRDTGSYFGRYIWTQR